MVPFSVISPYTSRRFATNYPPDPAWENPAARGMFFMITGASTWLERTGTSRVVRDCVSGQLGGDSSTTQALHTIGQAPNGPGFQYAGVGSRASSTLDFQFLPPQSAVMHITPATWVFVVRFASSTHMSLGCRSSGVAHSQGWNVGLNTTWGVTLLRSTTDIQIRCPSPALNKDTVLVITHDGSNTAANGRIFQDGALVSNSFTNGSGTSTTASAQALQFGNTQQVPSDGFIGTIYMAALFSRQMGDQEARDVSSNPWQLVRRRKTTAPMLGFQRFSQNSLFFGGSGGSF